MTEKARSEATEFAVVSRNRRAIAARLLLIDC
jgi:hypothetical protein